MGTCARGLRENVLGNERTNMKWWAPSHVPHWQVDLAWLVTGKQAKLDAQETSIATPNERSNGSNNKEPFGWGRRNQRNGVHTSQYSTASAGGSSLGLSRLRLHPAFAGLQDVRKPKS